MHDAVTARPEVSDVFGHHHLNDDAFVGASHGAIAPLEGGQREVSVRVNLATRVEVVFARLQFDRADVNR